MNWKFFRLISTLLFVLSNSHILTFIPTFITFSTFITLAFLRFQQLEELIELR
jgi:hypothetical protein